MSYENKTKTTKEPKQYLLKIHRGNKERDKAFPNHKNDVLLKEQESYSALNFRWLKELRHDVFSCLFSGSLKIVLR